MKRRAEDAGLTVTASTDALWPGSGKDAACADLAWPSSGNATERADYAGRVGCTGCADYAGHAGRTGYADCSGCAGQRGVQCSPDDSGITQASDLSQLVAGYAHAAGAALAELVWPTQCVICKSAGSLVCDACRLKLPYIDYCLSCPRCGAPYGIRQCTECNAFSLARLGLGNLPYDVCVSAMMFNDDSARIIRRYKDSGERRLSSFIAFSIACMIPPDWLADECLVSFVPSTKKAKRTRGFDHCEEIARECARMLDCGFASFLEVGRARDQRKLGRVGRFANARNRFLALSDSRGASVILIDDVLTTGATLLAASGALREAGARSVRCATFGRVYR